jgi:hypothetical protein
VQPRLDNNYKKICVIYGGSGPDCCSNVSVGFNLLVTLQHTQHVSHAIQIYPDTLVNGKLPQSAPLEWGDTINRVIPANPPGVQNLNDDVEITVKYFDKTTSVYHGKEKMRYLNKSISGDHITCRAVGCASAAVGRGRARSPFARATYP